jgi:hypothetical protein
LLYGKKPKEKCHIYTVMNNEYTFHPGIVSNNDDIEVRIQRRQPRTSTVRVSDISSNKVKVASPFLFMSLEERRKLPPPPGKIRMLEEPDKYPRVIARYWDTDMSLTEWIEEFITIRKQYKEKTISSVLYPESFLDTLHFSFVTNQRNRFLVRKVYRKWSQRVWMKRTQCNITLIDMEEFKDKDAIYLTDTKHHQIFRFHRSDVFKNFLTNISSCDEMLPSPRIPTNPWTNEPLTFQQTLSICNQMISYYAAKGKCPPLLFTAFCSSQYNIRTFRYKQASILAQNAIKTYFAEITPENRDVIEDTIVQLLYTAGCLFSPDSLHKWICSNSSPLHREWLSIVCDYTLYMNLHVQVRPYWYNQTYILMDIRRLYERSSMFREIIRPGTSTTHRSSQPAQQAQQAPSQQPQSEPPPLPPLPISNTSVSYSVYPIPNSVVQVYDSNQLLGLILSSEIEGTLSELIHQAQAIIDEQTNIEAEGPSETQSETHSEDNID